MADLDDFFAKRDKKKPKGKKFTTTEDLTKVLEHKAKERKNQETGRSTYVAPPTESGEPAPALSEFRQQVENEDDEWKEMEEAKPDYTGLKIQELILTDEEDDIGTKDSESKDDVNEEGKNGPWHKERKSKGDPGSADAENPSEEPAAAAAATTTATDAADATTAPAPATAEGEETKPEVEEEPVAKADEEASSEAPKTGGYVPPAKRSQMLAAAQGKPAAVGEPTSAPPAAAGAYVPPSRRAGAASGPSSTRKKQEALQLDSEEYFPTLGS